MSKISILFSVTVLVFLSSGCEKPRSWGELNSIIVGTSEDRWAVVGELVELALEAKIVTVRPEKTFMVTHQDPFQPEWDRLQRFRQILLIGTADDPWMKEVLASTNQISSDLPDVFQVEDVWAKGQTVTVMLLVSGNAIEAEPLMDPLYDLLNDQYREWVKNRMFMTGRNEALADSLWDLGQFSIMLPRLYKRRQEDSVFMFRNDNPDPSELIRQITITWRSYSPEEKAYGSVGMTKDDILTWRQEVADGHFGYPQVLDLSLIEIRRLQQADIVMEEVRTVWANPPEDAFPAGGPLITRVIPCKHQDRHYLADAWLYAPGKDKYQYILQLEAILNSFSCRRPTG